MTCFGLFFLFSWKHAVQLQNYSAESTIKPILKGEHSFYVSVAVSQMDPVQKAVINHTFGVPQPLKKKQIISCNICHLRFNSTVRNGTFLKGCTAKATERNICFFYARLHHVSF